MDDHNRQRVIPFVLDNSPQFSNFYGQKNQILIAQIKSLFDTATTSKTIYLWGESGVGKSHLLRASCEFSLEQGRLFQYIRITPDDGIPVGMLQINPKALVCLDGVEHGCQDKAWQTALFEIYERIVRGGGRIIFAASMPPSALPMQFADLTSRLQSGGVYNVVRVVDEEMPGILKLAAQHRGMQLAEPVIAYLLAHYNRQPQALFKLLDRIDSISLIQKRKITIPFIKDYL